MTQAPVTATSPNKFKIGLTFKAAAGYDAEWITPTVFGETAEEVAVNAVDVMKALADKGVIDLAPADRRQGRQLGTQDLQWRQGPDPAERPCTGWRFLPARPNSARGPGRQGRLGRAVLQRPEGLAV
jgi:hypothetical protein